MASYEEFKKTMKEKISNFLPEEYQSGDVRISPVNKVNYQTDMLYVITSSKTYSLSLDLKKLFHVYENCGDMNLVLQKAASDISSFTPEFSDYQELSLKDLKSRIVFQLVNTQKNEDLLKTVPHRNFLDLSVIYRCLGSVNDNDICSFIVKNHMTGQFGSEQELYSLAMENTKKLLPFRYSYIVYGMEYVPEFTCEIPDLTDCMMLIVSNRLQINGAAVMLYQDVLDKIAEKEGSDLYILPSSIHEILCLSTENTVSAAGLKKSVMEVNADSTSISPIEVLSDNVYRYSRAKKRVTIVTDDD